MGYPDGIFEDIISGKLFDLNFSTALGASGTTNLTWTDDPTPRELSNSVPEIITATWINGSVTFSPTITIETVISSAGSAVVVPVNVQNISDLVGFQWTILYDKDKLDYTGLNWDGNIEETELELNVDETNGVLRFAYNYETTPININDGLFFNLNFNVLGTATGTANITWSDSPTPRELSNSVPVEIVATWVDGMVILDLSWDGSESTDWQNPLNWTPEIVPTASHSALIPDVTPNSFPVIDDGIITAECRNMTIENSSTVTIAHNGQMTVSGTIENNAGASGLVIESNSAGDGSLKAENAVAATVQRFITGNVWHLIYPSLANVNSSLFTTETEGTNQNFYSYSEANEDYWNATEIFETSGWTSAVGDNPMNKGYIFNRYTYADKTYIETGGNINVAEKVFTISYNISTVTIGNGVSQARSYFDGWNLVGNPYTCAIDWEQVTYGDVEQTVYYYDASASNYKYYLKSGSTDTPYNVGITVNGGSQYIPMGQGFFVKAKNTGSTYTNGTFTIPLAARVHDENSTFFKSENKEIPNLIRLNIQKDNFTDETIIRCLETATEEHDGQFDAYKMYSWDKSKPQIYSLNDNNTVFAINTIPEINKEKVIKLGVYIGEFGEYTIGLDENYFNGYLVYLEDKDFREFVLLNSETNYTFTSEQASYEDRFYIHFAKNNPPFVNIEIEDQETYINELFTMHIQDNVFADIDFLDELEYSITLKNDEALPEWITFNQTNNELNGVPTDEDCLILKVKAIDIEGETAEDIFKLNILAPNSITNDEIDFSIYPIPTSEKIYINNRTGKDYILEIRTITGSIIYQNQFEKDNNSINLDNLCSGIYILNVKFEDNSSLVRKLIIE